MQHQLVSEVNHEWHTVAELESRGWCGHSPWPLALCTAMVEIERAHVCPIVGAKESY